MEFFGIGGLELLMLLVVALIIFGPDKLGGAARTMGKTIGEVKRQAQEAQQALKQQVDLRELDISSDLNLDTPEPGPEPSRQRPERASAGGESEPPASMSH
ncbi:MAG: twin-arginine translocase TatA/TatE family subunit [Chloroflexi bacterium]|nr:twin-arginine translocase TatA/TatE family subunit [Chloroflexota bacterium]